MKAIKVRSLLLACLLSLLGLATSAMAANVDLSKSVPDKVEITADQELVFENGDATFKVSDSDGKGELLVKSAANGSSKATVFKAKRTGTGEITVTITAQGQLTVVKSYKIALTVSGAATEIKEATDDDNGGTVSVAEGAVIRVSLRGRPSTGYEWTSSGKPSTDAARELGDPEYTEGSAGEGASGLYEFAYKATKAGSATINLEYRRGNEAPSKTFSLTIDVEPAGLKVKKYYWANGKLRYRVIEHLTSTRDDITVYDKSGKKLYVQNWVSGVAGPYLISIEEVTSKGETRRITFSRQKVEYLDSNGKVVRTERLDAISEPFLPERKQKVALEDEVKKPDNSDAPAAK